MIYIVSVAFDSLGTQDLNQELHKTLTAKSLQLGGEDHPESPYKGTDLGGVSVHVFGKANQARDFLAWVIGFVPKVSQITYSVSGGL